MLEPKLREKIMPNQVYFWSMGRQQKKEGWLVGKIKILFDYKGQHFLENNILHKKQKKNLQFIKCFLVLAMYIILLCFISYFSFKN